MLIDMHIHERTHSADSALSLEEIVTLARSRGLDGVCITDHDSMGLKAYAEAYAKRVGFPIFVGVEFFSLQGDITAWGIDAFPSRRVDAQTFLDQVNAAGGFCVACHPFRSNRRGLEEHLRTVRGLHGVEVYNGSTDAAANEKALLDCQALGCKPIGASDAHVPGQLGKYATWLPQRVTTLSDFVAQLRSAPTRPALWTGEGYTLA